MIALVKAIGIQMSVSYFESPKQIDPAPAIRYHLQLI